MSPSLDEELAGWQRELQDLDEERHYVQRHINRLEHAIYERERAEKAAQPDLFEEQP